MSDALRKWLEGINDGVVRLPRCSRCDTWNWYPRPLCRRCGCREVTWVNVGKAGRVHTWTEVVRAVDPVDGLRTPYITALIAPLAAPEVRIPMLLDACGRPPVIGEAVLFEVVETVVGRALAFSQQAC